jgi:hypothetical protein
VLAFATTRLAIMSAMQNVVSDELLFDTLRVLSSANLIQLLCF